MSDGPYRSLPLRQAWKKVARCAESAAFADDIRPLVIGALVGDLPRKTDVAIRGVFTSPDEPELFRSQNASVLAGLTHSYPGDQGVLSLVEIATRVLEEGREGSEGLKDTYREWFAVNLDRNVRSIHEHYIEEAGPRKSSQVVTAVLGAVNYSDAVLEGLAEAFAKNSEAVRRESRRSRQRGIEEGPRL